MAEQVEPHDPTKPVTRIEELAPLLIAGLESGEPRPMTDADWDALRRRATIDTPRPR